MLKNENRKIIAVKKPQGNKNKHSKYWKWFYCIVENINQGIKLP